ncbi:unnamed protein product [Protopolystoma xenopodis]|uniref:Uncharacterized protein n=1 Tax=Protopolystoma xenopodis TaxID=117903 RepID=A0A448WUZ7_9PLAT|nr:unnamed protein product [Protopolystoma xenopodis]
MGHFDRPRTLTEQTYKPQADLSRSTSSRSVSESCHVTARHRRRKESMNMSGPAQKVTIMSVINIRSCGTCDSCATISPVCVCNITAEFCTPVRPVPFIRQTTATSGSCSTGPVNLTSGPADLERHSQTSGRGSSCRYHEISTITGTGTYRNTMFCQVSLTLLRLKTLPVFVFPPCVSRRLYSMPQSEIMPMLPELPKRPEGRFAILLNCKQYLMYYSFQHPQQSRTKENLNLPFNLKKHVTGLAELTGDSELINPRITTTTNCHLHAMSELSLLPRQQNCPNVYGIQARARLSHVLIESGKRQDNLCEVASPRLDRKGHRPEPSLDRR